MTEQPRLKLEVFEAALRQRPGGAELADAFQAHIGEVVGLLNKNRRVAVVWQRYHGPAFLRAAIQGGPSQDVVIPKQVDGVSLEMLLLQMADALQRHGSPELRRAIAERSLQILRWARECGSFNDVLSDLETRRSDQEHTHG
jgi:hypothetical protein